MDFIEELKTLKTQVLISDSFKIPEHFDNIVISGMGGSGIVGKLFSELYHLKPVICLDDYDIPDFVGKNTVFIGISYSGNTEEAISCTKQALKKGAHVFVITSGGDLSKLSNERIVIPSGLQPRSAIGYMLMPLLNTFLNIDAEKRNSISNLINGVDLHHEEASQLGKEIANEKKIPVIYGFSPFRYVAYRWKTQFNENSKLMAINNYFPELNHNDTMSLRDTYLKETFFFITFGGSSGKISRRIDATEKVTSTTFHKVEPLGIDDIEKMFYLIHFGDYISLETAMIRNMDPRDVSSIEHLKSLIR
ncbi:bifunctional phosphoglucose/phosphomannose isomerase [Oxyplasma meridianum]|uniref:Bifunctional phosphoglucose/phosphomannose isomerase n=1 Tax=Oxyplasma meridianum TaxID=3073602 RepID=A0AAX4NGM4_9ARCH